MIIELPNFVDNETVDQIKNSIKPYVKKTEKSYYGTYRDGQTVNITGLATNDKNMSSLDGVLHNIFSKIQSDIIKRRYKPPFGSADSGYEYHIYRPGDLCHLHSDEEVSNGMLRYASVTLHLNTVNDGGKLVFPSQNKKIKTEKGKVVIFPPYGMFEHYVTESSENREVIVTWFVYDNVRVEVL